jgi:hypothetical protein
MGIKLTHTPVCKWNSSYYWLAVRLALKWLNRRSQRKSFSWAGFQKYLEHYPLPRPRIVHNLYTLSPVT